MNDFNMEKESNFGCLSILRFIKYIKKIPFKKYDGKTHKPHYIIHPDAKIVVEEDTLIQFIHYLFAEDTIVLPITIGSINFYFLPGYHKNILI